ncbi:hypothetical protein LB565_04195 [Mesorhizobium sp. CA14]|uniref:hypothetical protein n=1 Tax=Mesorhizobium sp. CA14 TaxID=2876642 RepID=UPI001CCF1623|nr:hypothetical protein [Mesorhizobium sp. CA14]MBZ9847189.1 hypothetical protein [Mesorhizobium sp. CA14]
MSAIFAVCCLAFPACAAPAAEFATVTVASMKHEVPAPPILAVPADFAIMQASQDMARKPVTLGAKRTVAATFAVYRSTHRTAARHRTFAVPWSA